MTTEIRDRIVATATQAYRLTYDDCNKIAGRHPLEQVALKVWGDEKLWWLIAEVNPVRDPADWSAGELVLIPLDEPSVLKLQVKK